MPRRYIQQTYVPTKKDSIPSLQNTHLNLPRATAYISTACAHSEQVPPLDLSVVELDGRWLQIPTAERWELLLSDAASTSETPNPSHQHAPQ